MKTKSPHHPMLFGLGLALVAAACASGSGPQALPPVSMAPRAPEIEEPVSTAPQELPLEGISESSTGKPSTAEGGDETIPTDEETGGGESAASTEEGDDITVVIEPASDEEQPKSLYAAAQAERHRREAVGESSIVINDKNLEKYAEGGQLTYVEEPAAEAGAEGEDTGGNEAEDAPTVEPGSTDLAKEEYWRDRVSDVRQAWREEIDRIGELESEIAALRRDFYAEDDPFYRDSQIKPKWDRALEALEESRRAAREHRERLDEVLEAGRKAGALPGWLREGIELEPTEEELEALDLGPESGEVGEDGTRFHQPSEPDVVEEDGEPDGR